MIPHVMTLCLILFVTTTAVAQDTNSDFGPFSPADAASRFVTHPDCKIELVAAEPDVIDPVHIAFDGRGKLWVVEMTDYPNGPGDSQPGLSRIRVLSDDDGNGRFENPVTFAEKLLFANGLMFWQDGVIVTTDGKITFMRDKDGDGTADETQVWFEGFATENPQLRHNHPLLGDDGKIYISNGLRGGNIVPGAGNPWKLNPATDPVSISGRDFRFDPLTGEYEAISGMGQFGMTFDRWGNRFVCTNRNPCRQIVLQNEQLSRTPGLRVARHFEDVSPAADGSRLYPLSRTWTTSNLHANQFTAACGVLIYQDQGLGSALQNNSFTCDPTANLVHRDVLSRNGPTFRSHYGREGVEFLATRDEWFRPVNLAHGPDGALYIVDMYRAVIEHPQFMPQELKDRPDLLLGTDRGRIWRVTAKSQEYTESAIKDLASVTSLNEISKFQAANAWQADHVFRQLLELAAQSNTEVEGATQTLRLARVLAASGKLSVAGLKQQYEQSVGDRDTARALIELGAKAFPGDQAWLDVIQKSLSSDREELAALLALHQQGRPLPYQMGDLTQDQLAKAATHVYHLLNEVSWSSFTEENREFMLQLLLARIDQGDDPYWLSTCLGISAGTDSQLVLNDLLHGLSKRESTAVLSPVVHDLAALVARQNQSGQVSSLLASIAARDDLDLITRMSLLAGLADGLSGGPNAVRALISKLDASEQQSVQTLLQAGADSFGKSETDSQLLGITAVLLSVDQSPETLSLLQESTGSGDAYRASLSLDALLKRPADQVNVSLVELLPLRRGAVRRGILQALASSESRAPALLDEIEAGRVPAIEIDATVEKLLYRHKNADLVARAKKLLKREPPADRVKVLAEYQECLTMSADPKRGRIVFEKNCATCHKVGDVGVNVAPDISDSRTKTPDFFLMNILDPNRAIDANYFSFNILDSDGLVHTGIVASETATSVTLKQPEGKMVTIAREEIEDFKNTGLSLMPVGLERTIDKQQMADVISFIKNWRYLDGQIPKEVIK